MKYCLVCWVLAAVGLASPAAAAEAASGDEVRAAVQAVCPVSGVKLGEHGPPVKAKIGEENVFLCCEACLKGKVSPEHWATIHTNFREAQGTCPIMGGKLPASAKWTVVEGQIVYVCCPPCIEKIKAAPADALEKLDANYRASLARTNDGQ